MKLTEFKQAIDDYFNDCEKKGEFPDEAGMALRLELDRGELERLLENPGRGKSGYRRALLDARLRRESVLTRSIYASEKAATGKIFLSRQSSAGGLRDKSDSGDDQQISVEVRITGMQDCFD